MGERAKDPSGSAASATHPGTGRREPRDPADRQSWHERGREIVIRQLSMMDRSRQQLSDAMDRKDVPADVREDVLRHFEEIGLIDDAHFARGLVRTRFLRRGSSRKAMADELRRKGIAPEVAETALREIGEEEEFEAALALAERRLARGGGNPATLDSRVYAALARRGYSPDVCSRALREARERALD